MLSKWKMRLRALFFRSRLERELREELRFHLERETEELIARGMSPEEARAAALRNFGGVEQAREACRDQRGVRLWEELWRDVSYSARILAKRPGFTLLVVFTLALGIGANTAIFSVVHAVLLRPLPYRSPEELMLVRHISKLNRIVYESVSEPEFQDWRARNHVFNDLAIFRVWGFSLRVGNERMSVPAAAVSANFFPLLGVSPVRGRSFTNSEEARGSEKVVLISYRLWLTSFQARESIVGEKIELDKQAYTVIGVLPPEYQFPFGLDKADIWVTTVVIPENMRARGARNFQAIARRRPGVTPQQAQGEMEAIAEQLGKEHPEISKDESVKLVPPHEELTRDVRLQLWLLFAAVGIVLLISCTNVANLLLMRAVTRQKELAIRAAIGAGGGRIMRQLLTESLLLSLTGGAWE